MHKWWISRQVNSLHKVETRHTREGVSSQREIAAHVLMRQATELKRKGGMAMYKYILNKINKYHQEITVDDKFWTYLKADEVQDELDDLEEYEQIIVEQYLKYVQDDLEEVLEKLSNHSIWWREEMSWEDLIKELGAEGYWGDSFDKLEDYLDYDKLADTLIDDGFIECDFGFLEIAQ